MSEDKPALAFIGIGLMGLPMSLRLLDKGFAVHVRDVERAKLAPALAKGAVEAATPAAAAGDAEVVLVCLLGTDIVEEVVFGAGGVAEAAAPDKVLVDISTTDAKATRNMAERLKAETGMGWVDAPVSGGPPAAARGALTMMVGGEDDDVDKVMPVLAALAGQITHMGPCGAGQITKMINQILVLTNFCILAEALSLAENAGVDAAKIPECLAGGYADSAMLRHHYPRMVARAFEPPAGYVKQVLKDLDMVHDLAKATRTATPMTSQAAELYRLLVARGFSDLDATAIFKLYDQEPL